MNGSSSLTPTVFRGKAAGEAADAWACFHLTPKLGAARLTAPSPPTLLGERVGARGSF